MSNYETARLNMVESQIRPNQVTDGRILRAMATIPRERFVPASMRALAYMDQEVPLRAASRDAPARYLMAPLPLARLIQLADIGASDLVLEVGAATGYATAILARLAGAVVALEQEPALAETAARVLGELGVDNVASVIGPLAEGYPQEGPYDAIVLLGSVPEVPEKLLAQLKDGGRLVAIVADNGLGKATLFEKVSGDISSRAMFDAWASPLPGFERAPAFTF